MMQKDKEYMDMKKWIGNMRDETLIENVLGDKLHELDNEVLDNDKNDTTITLDNNLTAKVISDSKGISTNITQGLETILNGFITAIQGTITTIELITVHIGDTSMNITINCVLHDGHGIALHVDSESQNIQMKYDNFLILNNENVQFMSQCKNYFNPKLMSQLQGAIKTV